MQSVTCRLLSLVHHVCNKVTMNFNYKYDIDKQHFFTGRWHQSL
jgi:hypothetical protein